MTIKELRDLCNTEIDNGKGDNNIVLCVRTDEFYSLDAGFSSPVYNDSAIYDFIEAWEVSEDDVSVLN